MKFVAYFLSIIYTLFVRLRFSGLASDIRVCSLRLRGANVGSGVSIRPGCVFSGCSGINIGDMSYIGENSSISATGSKVEIGKGVLIGPSCLIVARNHIIDSDVPVKESGYCFSPVVVGDDVWIGGKSVVLAGSVIGSSAVIGGASLVNTAVASGSIFAGVPAKFLRYRNCNSGNGSSCTDT
jgi:acetyltransferase-like isoleucine patch superfamily enzyme